VPPIPLLNRRKPPFPPAKRGKDVGEITAIPPNNAITGFFSKFRYRLVRDSSRTKPDGASVAGSWSYRGVSVGTISISPTEFTWVAMLARVNLGLVKIIDAGAVKKTQLAI
jgi:hypothetical protein